jgi:glycosyltransferase involved in cell wall biosynthesis
MSKKKVLIITIAFSPNIGGLETHQDDFCSALLNNGYKYVVLTYQPLMTKLTAVRYEQGDDFEIYRYGWFGNDLYHKIEKYPSLLFFYMVPALFIRSVIYMFKNHRQIDYIHAQGFMMSSIAKFLKFVFRKKTFVTLHALFDDLYDLSNRRFLSKILRFMLSHQDGVITFSKKSKDEVLNLGVDKNKVVLTPHWVDINRFSPKSVNGLSLVESERINILFIGRYLEKKGIRVLLEAAQIFKDKVNFLFVGSGPLDDLVITADSKMENVINFGVVNYSIIEEIYWKADILIIPSLYEELFGRVIAEALAAGLPVIGTNIGSIPDIINNDIGWLAEPNSKSIFETISKVVKNPRNIIEKKRLVLQYAKENFSDENAKVIFNKYEE